METTLTSLEEYLRKSYEPDVEYVDGVLIRRNVGTQLRGLLQSFIIVFLSEFRLQYRYEVFTECRLLMDAATGRHRIPDVMVLEEPFTMGKAATDVPAVVVEIKSPDDTLDEVIDKCLEYATLGVPNIVVLDPDYKRQYVFTNRALQLVDSIVLHLPKCGAELPLPMDRLFSALKK